MDRPNRQQVPGVGEIDSRIADILLRYEELREQGQPVSARELCAACPELLAEVERHLRALHGLQPFLGTTVSALGKAGGDTPRDSAERGARLPQVCGRYRILRQLGEGGMGVVYLAHDSALDRQVALKVPHFTARTNAAVLERFHREARAAATLQHPNICPVFDVGARDGVHYLSMAYIEGQPLSALVRGSQGLPDARAACLVHKIALAMAEAHRHGIVHRDLKPSNIMINSAGEPVLMDFGLAQRAQPGEGRLTQSGMALGTPAYMPPEQIEGDHEAIGPRSDVYSLGVILYELLTGKLPFRGQGLALLSQILTKPPLPLKQARPGVHPRLAALCAKAMAKQPKDRFAGMTEMAAALDTWLKQAEGAQKSKAKKRWLVALSSAAAAAAILGVVLYVATSRGTVQIEIDDKRAVVSVNGDVITIDKLGEPITLWAGKNRLTVKRGDITVKTEEFVLHRGEHRLLEIKLLPNVEGTGREQLSAGERAAAKVRRAEALFRDKLYDEVIAACTDAIKLDARKIDAYLFRAFALDSLRKREDAIQDYKEALLLEPKNGFIYVWRSHTYLNLQRPDSIRCIADANMAIALANIDQPSMGAAYANRGWALAFLGHYELALADLDEAIRLDPIYFDYRSKVHEKLGNKRAANADRETAASSRRQLLASSLDAPPLLPDGKPGQLLPTFQVSDQQVNSVALSPSARLALSGGLDGKVILWDVSTGGEVFRFSQQQQMVHSVAFSADGQKALFTRGDTFVPDRQQPGKPATDFSIALWDVHRRKPLDPLVGHSQGVCTAGFFPDGKQVLSADCVGTIRLWDVATGKVVHIFECNGKEFWRTSLSQSISPDGSKAMVAGGSDHQVHVYDLKTGKEIDRLDHGAFVRAVAYSPDGQQALSGSWDKTMCLWDITARKKIRTFPTHGTVVNAVAFANNGRWAIAATGGFADGNRFVKTGGKDCAIHVYDTATGEKLQEFTGHAWDVVSVAVSSDNRYLLSGSTDGTIRLWRMPFSQRDTSTMKLVLDRNFNKAVKDEPFRVIDNKDATWTVADGEYRMLAKWGPSHWTSGADMGRLDDFVCRVEGRVTRADGAGWGLLFGENYAIELKEENGHRQVRTLERQGDDWRWPKGMPWIPVPNMRPITEFNTLRVEVTGKQVRLFINDRHVADQKCAKLSPGILQLRLTAYEAQREARFRRIQVWRP
jgi:WD40 repeat protein/predicted Ser/Thr protein kinase